MTHAAGVRAAGSFVPDGAVTGIGSLPFATPDDAVAFVAEHAPAVPFWPQLLGPDLVRALLAEALAAPEAGAPGFLAFLAAAERGAFARARAVKGQVTGPLTLAWLLRVSGVRAIERADTVELITTLVIRRATEQIRALQRLRLPVIIFVDEPALLLAAHHCGAVSDISVLRTVCRAIRTAGGIAGLHCCALVDPGRLCEAEPDIVSFDAIQGMTVPIDDARTLGFWSGSGIVAFGLVPPSETGAPPQAEDLFTRWLLAGVRGGDYVGLAARTMITATCGLALQSPDDAERSFRTAARLATLVRRVAAGDVPAALGRTGVTPCARPEVG